MTRSGEPGRQCKAVARVVSFLAISARDCATVRKRMEAIQAAGVHQGNPSICLSFARDRDNQASPGRE